MENFALTLNKNKYTFLVLFLLFTLPNLFLSHIVELSFDETYYWIYSQFLDFGYYDHPPMVGLSIYLGTLIFGQNEFGVRFFSNLYLFGTIFVLWDMCKIYKQSAVFWSLLFSMPLIGLSGLVALPDAPLMFFSTAFFWGIQKYLKEDSMKWVIGIGVIIASMFYSKYHGLLIVLLTVIANPSFFKRKSFYGIIALVVILYTPHMYWQYQHEFVSFKFHLFGRTEKHFSINNIFDYIGGQIALMGFFSFFLFVYIFYKNKFKDPFERILIFNSFGFLIFLFFMSFRNQIEANWTISCSIALIILLVKYLAKYKKTFLILSIPAILITTVLKLALFNLDSFVKPSDTRNRLNEIVLWKNIRIPKILETCKNTKIVGDNYQITSKIAFYTGKKEIPALHLGSRESQYSILNLQKEFSENEEICYLTSKNLKGAVRIESNYKDPVYIIEKTTLNDLATQYGMTYEEITRNRI